MHVRCVSLFTCPFSPPTVPPVPAATPSGTADHYHWKRNADWEDLWYQPCVSYCARGSDFEVESSQLLLQPPSFRETLHRS